MKNEVQQTVELLNELLWEEDKYTNSCFVYTQAGFVDLISVNIAEEDFNIEIKLWDSENSTRFHTRDLGYEPLEETILRNFNKAIIQLREVDKHLNQ